MALTRPIPVNVANIVNILAPDRKKYSELRGRVGVDGGLFSDEGSIPYAIELRVIAGYFEIMA